VTEPHEDESIAAYALGALNLESAERVHGHLGTCPRCRALTLRALHAACALPFSLPLYAAPAELKDRVLRAAQGSASDRGATTEVAAEAEAPAEQTTIPSMPAPASVQLDRRTIAARPAWIVAIAGWIVAASAILYSHGLSDRVRVTRVNSARDIAGLKKQLSGAALLRAFLTSPDLSILPLKNWVSATSNTRVELITRARSSQEIILAQNLAAPLSGEIYVVWLKVENHHYQRIGTFATGPHGQGLTILNAAFPLEDRSTLGISEEPLPAPNAPTTPLLFTVTLGSRPTATPTVVPATATIRPTGTASPTATRRATATATVPPTHIPVRRTPGPPIRFPRIP
jgi:hypothetical protein